MIIMITLKLFNSMLVIGSKDPDGMVNIADPDHTASVERQKSKQGLVVQN